MKIVLKMFPYHDHDCFVVLRKSVPLNVVAMASVLSSLVRCVSVMLGGHLVTAAYQPAVLNVITTLVMLRQGSVTVPMATQVCVISSLNMWEIW